MSAGLVAPGANWAGSRYGVSPVDAVHTAIAETDGLIFCVDADQVGQATGSLVQKMNEAAQGRALFSYLGTAPTIFQDPASNNGHWTFQMGAISECSLSLQDKTVPQAGTFICFITPNTATINGSNDAFIFSAWDQSTTTRKLSLQFNHSSQLVLNEPVAGGGVIWTYGGALVGGTQHIIAVTWDSVAKTMAIYCDDPNTPVATATNVNIGDLSNCRFTFFGSKSASGSLRCGAAEACGYNRVLGATELAAIINPMKSYYGMA